ncbi:vesicle transport through interaction with t-SNARE 1 [Strigomonas culicis]|uniref:Vesicle transport through interaction with t-SNARE 1 n=1 Tax=Strigomonas culicis TaxID=28005 RepID=S9UTY6_9TRYP|nr:vesicle transport through interaction with t-SNARE 1 [Strigomonas culicis]EPY34402.1 vesicle transport through interaction with t-SNARE 1 [Strigomonas culicis]|eukprot:EPY32284.1 vesicle transport through interaction with t-SNARE 1 [Strigomonas culicis]
MSSLFTAYEEEYKSNVAQVRQTLGALRDDIAAQQANAADPSRPYRPPPSAGPQCRVQRVQLAQQMFAQSKDLVSSMSYEASDMAGPAQADARRAADQYRRELAQLEAEVQEARKACTAADRTDLLAFGGGERDSALGGAADADTQALRLTAVQTTERLQGGTKTLLQAEAYLNQANELGQNSLHGLRKQREVMVNIQNTTGEVDDEVSQARVVLRRMESTALKHKLWLFGIIFMLIVFLCIIIYIRVK